MGGVNAADDVRDDVMKWLGEDGAEEAHTVLLMPRWLVTGWDDSSKWNKLSGGSGYGMCRCEFEKTSVSLISYNCWAFSAGPDKCGVFSSDEGPVKCGVIGSELGPVKCSALKELERLVWLVVETMTLSIPIKENK